MCGRGRVSVSACNVPWRRLSGWRGVLLPDIAWTRSPPIVGAQAGDPPADARAVTARRGHCGASEASIGSAQARLVFRDMRDMRHSEPFPRAHTAFFSVYIATKNLLSAVVHRLRMPHIPYIPKTAPTKVRAPAASPLRRPPRTSKRLWLCRRRPSRCAPASESRRRQLPVHPWTLRGPQSCSSR